MRRLPWVQPGLDLPITALEWAFCVLSSWGGCRGELLALMLMSRFLGATTPGKGHLLVARTPSSTHTELMNLVGFFNSFFSI